LVLEGSVLLEIAEKKKVSDVYEQPIDRQIVWFNKTLTKLEDFLDTGDLTQLTPESLSVIKTDLLNIINGFRQLDIRKSAEVYAQVTSIDKILKHLRDSRNIIFTCDSMFDGKKLRDEKTETFYKKMDECREHIAESLKAFL
jgi:hypothetical protein